MSENYTINQQHHSKKDIDVYVVRLTIKVDKEIFNELKTTAKEHNGYYSSFRGVHGFVFTLEEDAISFGEELDECLVNTDELSEDDNVSDSIGIPEEISDEIQLPLFVDTTKIVSKWTKKMNDDQTNDFFLSITEYDNWGEVILRVKLRNLGYYINSFGRLTISCEIHRTDISDRWANLFFAIYDSKNRIKEKGLIDCLYGDMFSKPCICSCTEIKPSQIAKIKLYWE